MLGSIAGFLATIGRSLVVWEKNILNIQKKIQAKKKVKKLNLISEFLRLQSLNQNTEISSESEDPKEIDIKI
jgi:hypothetical protein